LEVTCFYRQRSKETLASNPEICGLETFDSIAEAISQLQEFSQHRGVAGSTRYVSDSNIKRGMKKIFMEADGETLAGSHLRMIFAGTSL